MRVEKEWGCVSMVWWEKCGGSQARYDSGKTIRNKKRSWSNQISSCVVGFLCCCLKLVVTFFCIFLFVHPPGFCSFFAASWGESSVFINREDTSISVAVMHTG